MPNILTKMAFLKITASILLPLVALGIPARMLDNKLGTSPWILLGAMFVALHVTLAIVFFMFRKVFSSINAKN